MKWHGNLTLKMGDKEDTYSPSTLETERYSESGIAIKSTSLDGRGTAILHMTPSECKELIKALIDSICLGV
jgi:hypothetical protein